MISPESRIRLPPKTNAPAVELNVIGPKGVSAVLSLFGVSRVVPSKMSASLATGAVRFPSQLIGLVQLLSVPPPSQVRFAAGDGDEPISTNMAANAKVAVQLRSSLKPVMECSPYELRKWEQAVYHAQTKWQLAAPQNFNHWEAHPRRLPCTDPENTVNSYSFLLTRYVQVNIAQWGAGRISDEMAAALAIRAAPGNAVKDYSAVKLGFTQE